MQRKIQVVRLSAVILGAIVLADIVPVAAAESTRACDQYGEPASATGVITNMRGQADAGSKVWGFDIWRSAPITTTCRITAIAADKPIPPNCRNGARFRADGIAIGNRLSAKRLTCD